MKDPLSVLLVHDRDYPLDDLKAVLDRLTFNAFRTRSCAETNFVLTWSIHPVVVFTDADLPDGSWAEIVSSASQTQLPTPVIVVSSAVDLSLYLDTLEGGAADFIVPPFRDDDIRYVVEGAMVRKPRTPFLLSRPAYPPVPPAADPNRQNYYHERARRV